MNARALKKPLPDGEWVCVFKGREGSVVEPVGEIVGERERGELTLERVIARCAVRMSMACEMPRDIGATYLVGMHVCPAGSVTKDDAIIHAWVEFEPEARPGRTGIKRVTIKEPSVDGHFAVRMDETLRRVREPNGAVARLREPLGIATHLSVRLKEGNGSPACRMRIPPWCDTIGQALAFGAVWGRCEGDLACEPFWVRLYATNLRGEYDPPEIKVHPAERGIEQIEVKGAPGLWEVRSRQVDPHGFPQAQGLRRVKP